MVAWEKWTRSFQIRSIGSRQYSSCGKLLNELTIPTFAEKSQLPILAGKVKTIVKPVVLSPATAGWNKLSFMLRNPAIRKAIAVKKTKILFILNS